MKHFFPSQLFFYRGFPPLPSLIFTAQTIFPHLPIQNFFLLPFIYLNSIQSIMLLILLLNFLHLHLCVWGKYTHTHSIFLGKNTFVWLFIVLRWIRGVWGVAKEGFGKLLFSVLTFHFVWSFPSSTFSLINSLIHNSTIIFRFSFFPFTRERIFRNFPLKTIFICVCICVFLHYLFNAQNKMKKKALGKKHKIHKSKNKRHCPNSEA